MYILGRGTNGQAGTSLGNAEDPELGNQMIYHGTGDDMGGQQADVVGQKIRA